MKTTIDRAGRVVIPAAIRERLRLTPGTTLDIELDDDGAIRLLRHTKEPEVLSENGRWVIRAQEEVPDLDIASLVDEERSRWPL